MQYVKKLGAYRYAHMITFLIAEAPDTIMKNCHRLEFHTTSSVTKRMKEKNHNVTNGCGSLQ